MNEIQYHCPLCKFEKTVWNNKARKQRLCKGCGHTYQLGKIKPDRNVDKEIIKELKLVQKENEDALEKLIASYNLLSGLSKTPLSVPKWLTPKKNLKDRSTASVMLSDCHFDEVVNAAEVNYVNGYSRVIAKKRLQQFFTNTINLSRDHMSGITLDGLVLNLGGDMVSGNIHEELKCSNESGIMATVVYWSEQLAAGITLLLEHFDNIFVPCVTGNHGRNSQKPIKKGRCEDNFDWLIYKILEQRFKNEKGIKFSISAGSDERYTIYKTRYQLTHGDQFRGGSGISGIWTPITLGDHRKRQREQATGTPYDILIMGHFHQYIDGGKFMINGSLKGYDEFAASCNFGFESPKQLFWLTHPIQGKTVTCPIHCQSKSEGWEKKK